MGALKPFFVLLAVCMALTTVQPVLAADTGARVATNVVSSGTNWSGFTVGNLNTSNNVWASNATSTDYGVVSSFTFGVPAGAQIDGIQVDVEGRNSNNNKTVNYAVALSGNAGSGWTTAKTDTFTDNVDDTDSLGGPSDDWGWTWGDGGFSNANFQLRIYRTGGDFSLQVDLIQVTVYYSAPSYTQANFRGRNDNGNEIAATWKAAADTNWTQKVDENFRVRFVVQETAGISAADKTFQLEYNRNGGGWNDVNAASSVVRAWASPNVADGADTTQQVGSGTFVTPNAGFDEVNGLAGGASMDFSGSDEVEVEYSVQIRSVDVANDDTIQLRVKGLDSYTSTPTATVSGIPEFDQASFRGRNDDGNETTATWEASANVDWTQAMDQNFRVRFVIQETGDGAAADQTFQLEYNHNGSGWNDVNASSSVVRAWASPNVADGADTTQQVGSGTFVTPNAGFDEVNGLAGGTSLDFSGSDEVEVAYCVQIRSADVSADDTIQLRVKGLDSYTNTPTVTASSGTPPAYDQHAFRARNDNGNETTATWKAAADTNWTQKVDENFRVRFVVHEDNGVSEADKTFQLEYNRNGGGWNDVTGASSVVRAWASSNVADGSDTTQQVGSGTFITPNAGFDEADGQVGGSALDFAGSDEVELEFSLQIRSADVANGDTIQLRIKDLNTYESTPTATVTGILEFVQDSFRGRNNDGSETTATWQAAANVNWTQAVEGETWAENFRVRFLVRENGGVSSADKTFQLEYNLNGGGWTDVTGSSTVIKAVASDDLTDGGDTTQQLGSGTFISPNAGIDEVNGQAGGTALDFAGSDEVELEFSLRILGEDVLNNDTIQLRIKGLNTYTNTPTITVEDCTFHRYRKITIQSSQVEADLTDFPVMIKITGTDFQGIEDDVTDADGDDIIFRPSLTKGQLDHEFEVYDTTNDIMVAWVKVPSVSGSSNTDIYMYYGNACISSSTQNAAGVWSNGYEAVYHLHGDWNDSTGSHNGTGGQTRGYVSGQIANGVDFEAGNSDYIDIGTWSVSGDELTLQAWVQYESFADERTILDKSSGTDASNYVWNLSTDRSGATYRARYYMPSSVLFGSTTFSTSTWYMVVGKYDGTASRKYIRIDNAADNDSAQSGNLTENTNQVRIGDHATGGDQPFDGVIDEVRISSVARSNAWLNTEYNNQSAPATFFTLGPETPATAVKLLRFEAKGDGDNVNVEWETAHEIGNMGFYLYRADHPAGPYTRLNDGMMAGSVFGTAGRSYRYVDTGTERGKLYYFKLEDVDDHGKRTLHGPICVDWDADGLPDDWELAYGFDPTVDDAMFDADGDGLTNLEEYQRGTDPTNPDTDGDGILDGDEVSDLNPDGSYATRSLTAGVEVIAEDSTGLTLELNTQNFDSRVISVEGQEFERLSIPGYIHGYTQQVGSPELPLKGILVDIPAGQHAVLTVLETDVRVHQGYQVYPVPQKVGPEDSDSGSVGEVFAIDDSAYENDDYYPWAAAELSASFVYRGNTKQQVLFYPLAFNPVIGEIRHLTRLRVRIDYVDGDLARASSISPSPWQPPAKNITFDNLSPIGVMASVFGAPPGFVSPLLSALLSFQGLVAAAWAPPDEDVSNAAYKITVASEGIYEIDWTVLTNNGIDPALIDFSSLRLYHLGDEVAIAIHDDNSNDGFDAADTIRFYAAPVAAAYAKYAPNNVYWMTLSGGIGSPRRMAEVDGTPAGGTQAVTHSYTHHHELNQTYWSKAPGEDNLDRWIFGAYALGTGFLLGNGNPNPNSGAPVDVNITLTDVGGAMKGTVTMLLYGAYETDHEVDVSINGGAVTTLTWSGRASREASFEDVDLVDGVNTVTITCQSPTDSIAFDWFEITYDREFTAVSDTLQFVHEDGHEYQVAGFSTESLAVFDITDAAGVKQVTNWQTAGGGPYSLTLQPADAAGDERTYLALAEADINTPVSIAENRVSDLANTANGADYILITHRDLGWDINGDAESWLDDLVAHRQAQGLRVVLVDVQDIYDEFSYGMTTPVAIKDFLSYAYDNWTAPAPRYVLLVGDAIYDFHDRWGTGKTNYVPSYLSYTQFMGETAADEWYVTVSGDDAVPDLYIGRLPAATAAAAGIMVAKITDYENRSTDRSWENDVLLVADDQDEDWEAVFEAMNDDAAAFIPDAMNSPFEGYLRIYEAEGWDLNTELVSAIDAGALMVNYAGHASYAGWANEQIFNSGHAAGLNNTDRLPFFVSMSCLTGYFINTAVWDTAPLVEPLMGLADRGAVAALMPTGMTATEGQHILNSALFEQVFTKDRRELGAAIANAKMTLLANGNADFEEVSRTFVLFGDPAMQLKVPIPRRPQGLTAEQQGTDAIVALSWQAAVDADGAAVAGYHVYRRPGSGGSYQLVSDELVAGTQWVDIGLTLGTRYYYMVRAVDALGVYSVDSESVSIVVPVPTASLAGSSSGSSNGSSSGRSGVPVVCFVSTAKGSINPDFIGSWIFFGLIMVLGVLGYRRPSSPDRLPTSLKLRRDKSAWQAGCK